MDKIRIEVWSKRNGYDNKRHWPQVVVEKPQKGEWMLSLDERLKKEIDIIVNCHDEEGPYLRVYTKF